MGEDDCFSLGVLCGEVSVGFRCRRSVGLELCDSFFLVQFYELLGVV